MLLSLPLQDLENMEADRSVDVQLFHGYQTYHGNSWVVFIDNSSCPDRKQSCVYICTDVTLLL